MVQQYFDLSILDSTEQGTGHRSPLRVPVSDTLGRAHVIETPIIGTTYYLRDSNSYISTIVTDIGSSRYFIEIITRTSASYISTIATTSSYSNDYI